MKRLVAWLCAVAAIPALAGATDERGAMTVSKESFSRLALIDAGPGDPAPIEKLGASDGTPLGYRRYESAEPVAVLIFIHGGGAHSGAGYPHLAAGLRDDARVAVYTPDVRGHGGSGGPPGDAPSAEQLWQDVASFVALARDAHPGLPVFVGGHSSGAGVALNYASWPDRPPVDGYVFLSPQLGHRSNTAREPDPNDPAPAFADVSILPFVVNGITGWMGHSEAVRFNYPAEVLEADPGMVRAYTVNLANGVTPQAPADQFGALDRPFGLWIGERDELFVPEAVIGFGDLAQAVREESTSAVLADETHLSVLVDAHLVIAPWLQSRVAAGTASE